MSIANKIIGGFVVILLLLLSLAAISLIIINKTHSGYARFDDESRRILDNIRSKLDSREGLLFVSDMLEHRTLLEQRRRLITQLLREHKRDKANQSDPRYPMIADLLKINGTKPCPSRITNY